MNLTALFKEFWGEANFTKYVRCDEFKESGCDFPLVAEDFVKWLIEKGVIKE